MARAHMSSRFAFLSALALFSVGVLTVQPSVAASAALPTTGLEYVALGDSYAAGFGLTPLTGVPVPGCLQSSSNYPHQLALALELNLTDVTCSGATTANILTTPQDTSGLVPGGGTAPIQIAALSASTDIVTLSIGGNDLGFATVAASCVALTATGPVAGPPSGNNTCEAIYAPGGVDSLAALLTTTVAPAILATINAITAAAPNAKVFVVSYPSILPDAANTPSGPDGCFRSVLGANGVNPPYPANAFPFTPTDVVYLHQTEQALDDAIEAAATTAGVEYIPMFDPTLSNSACQTNGTDYVNGISLESLVFSPFSYTLFPGALHPNLAGATFMAQSTQPAIAAAFPAVIPAILPATGSTVGLALWAGAAAVTLGLVVLVYSRLRRTTPRSASASSN